MKEEDYPYSGLATTYEKYSTHYIARPIKLFKMAFDIGAGGLVIRLVNKESRSLESSIMVQREAEWTKKEIDKELKLALDQAESEWNEELGIDLSRELGL